MTLRPTVHSYNKDAETTNALNHEEKLQPKFGLFRSDVKKVKFLSHFHFI